MSQWSYVKKPNWVGDGKDTYAAGNVVASASGWIYQPTGEVLVAIGQLTTKSGDVADQAVPPTFTAAVSYSGTLNMVTGDVITVTLTASEPVAVTGTPTINLTIGANTRTLSYDAVTSTSTSLKFKYTIVAGDLASNWTANHAYSIGDKYLHAGQWHVVNTGYTSGAVFDHLKVATATPTVGGSGFHASTTQAVTFTGGTQVVAATATATIDATGAVTGINVTSGGEYSVAPTGVTVANPAVTITNATWLAGVATFTAANHGFVTGYTVTIAGMTPAGYNVTGTITVTDANTFTIAIVADPGAATVFGTATSTVVEPTVTIATAAIDTPNIANTTQQVSVATATAGGSVADILPTGAHVTTAVTFTAPDTSLSTAN